MRSHTHTHAHKHTHTHTHTYTHTDTQTRICNARGANAANNIACANTDYG
jgi:hypothetical protein